MTTRRWTGPRPINVYVIERHDGLVLFDTGQDRASVTDPGYFPRSGLTGLIYRRLARFEIAPDQTLTARLAAIGYDIADVHTAVLSHLHTDHIGGLAELRHADLVLHQREWDTLGEPRPEARGLLREHIDLPGLRWRPVTPQPVSDPALAPFTAAHDLFGDGSLVLLPTPGPHAGLAVDAGPPARRDAAADGRRRHLRRAPDAGRLPARARRAGRAALLDPRPQHALGPVPGPGHPARPRPGRRDAPVRLVLGPAHRRRQPSPNRSVNPGS